MQVPFVPVCAWLLGACCSLLMHELGHYLASGCKIKFRLVGFRGVWDMPEDAADATKVWVAKWGFGTQLLLLAAFVVAMRLFSIPMFVEYMFSGFAVALFLEWMFYPPHSPHSDFNFLAYKE